ncbi:MAG TPA: DUF5715 family protein [Pyrinomonadaceae bacterium]|nr:DUF5715 family protein [Pyrinomonadaceae bacterium]
MMNLKVRNSLLFIVVTAVLAAAVWALTRARLQSPTAVEYSNAPEPHASDPDLWARSMEKVKEARGDTGNVAMEIPSELRHYEERRWFLATQVAEVKKFNLQPVQDFVDLAATIKRGEMVPLPAVTGTYILFGVGARVDGDAFTRYVANENLELNDEGGLRDAYTRLESERAQLQKQISELQAQAQSHPAQSHLAAVKNGDATKQDELEIEVLAKQQELRSNEASRALINRYYGLSSGSQGSGPKLLRDYDSLQALAKYFGGRSFNVNDSADRETLKVYLLSSLRPQALKVLEEIAKRYHDKFARPLPVSSLIRPEQYQRALRRVNRYAVTIDTPPHSTGLAFDINYRYMSIEEQNFVMDELARMKGEGRIEALRERGANYHVFAFIDGQRPSDDLINASLNEAGRPVKQPNSAEETQSQQTSASVQTKSRAAKNTRRTPNQGAQYPRQKRSGR